MTRDATAATTRVGTAATRRLGTAAIAGVRVVAIDLHEEKLELARELGAEFTVNAATENPVEAIQALGGADQAIALSVSPRAFEQAYRSLRRGARSCSSPCPRTTR